jgi:immunoglobulin-binding protein 1
MESEMNTQMEKLRRRFEKLEDDSYEKENEIKEVFNGLNEIFIKVRETGTFSNNEEFKDIKPEDIKYLLIPYYQAELIQKFMENRLIRLEQGLKFYEEFYKILNTYSALSKEQKALFKALTQQDDNEEDEDAKRKKAFEQMAVEREEKIRLFKYKKALSDKIKVNYCK